MKPARRFGAIAQLAVFLAALLPAARTSAAPAAAVATSGAATAPATTAPATTAPATTAPARATAGHPAAPLAAHTPPAAPRPRVRQVPPNRIIAVLGQPVFGPDGKVIGRLTDVLVNAAGVPEAALIDFGGFMGVGSRTIAVHWSTLRFHPAAPENRIGITLLPAEIAAAPQYKGTHRPAPVVVEPPRPPTPVADATPTPAAPPARVPSAAVPAAAASRPPVPLAAPPPVATPAATAPAATAPAAIPPGGTPAVPSSVAAPSGQPAGAR